LISLRPITRDNWFQCTQLQVTTEQKKLFTAPVVYWLAESKYEKQFRTSAIYHHEILVGFAVYVVNEDGIGEVEAIMVDYKYQQQGYGKAAMNEIIGLLKNQHRCHEIRLSHRRANKAASKLYESLGFRVINDDGPVIRSLLLNDPNLSVCREQTQTLEIVEVHRRKELFEEAVNVFWRQWGNDKNYDFYRDCMQHSGKSNMLPKFYVALQEESIVGTYALLQNELVSRGDLSPWLGCLYVLPEHRGKKVGSLLLKHAEEAVMRLGYAGLFLCTDLNGYYEKYGWERFADGYGLNGKKTKIYMKLGKEETYE
jgi:GNAT superfamily N-acetyltransferase